MFFSALQSNLITNGLKTASDNEGVWNNISSTSLWFSQDYNNIFHNSGTFPCVINMPHTILNLHFCLWFDSIDLSIDYLFKTSFNYLDLDFGSSKNQLETLDRAVVASLIQMDEQRGGLPDASCVYPPWPVIWDPAVLLWYGKTSGGRSHRASVYRSISPAKRLVEIDTSGRRTPRSPRLKLEGLIRIYVWI